MRCKACEHESPPGARFCMHCAAPLAVLCGGCASELPAGARFCPQCARPVAAAPPSAKIEPPAPLSYTPKHLAEKILRSRSALEGERKEVTVMFADVKGSMELAGRLGAEAWHQVLEGFFAILTEGVHRYEGTVNQYTGDGIMALFGAPLAHEDHAQRACYAALDVRERLSTYADRLRVERGIDFGVRVGLNSGEVVVGRIGDDLRMDYTAQGHTVGLAQRIEQLAAPGRVYVSDSTRRLVEPYFAMREHGMASVAGIEAPIAIHELTAASGARTRLEAARTRGLSGFVGRDGEMQTLATALERAREGYGQVVGVVGEPGIGKSRLCHEFVEHCRREGVPVYEARCLAHGRNLPLVPILELFRAYFGIEAQDTAARARERIDSALAVLDGSLQEALPVLYEFMGVATADEPNVRLGADARQRLLFALLRQLYRTQAERGVVTVVMIDDVHWIDPASDAFLAQMAEATAEMSRNVLLLNFRPEYQADWLRRAHYHQLPLVPLGTRATQALLAHLLGDDPSLGDLAPRILRWTAGNPFYIEELVREMREAGHLSGAAGAYRLGTDAASLPVPVNVRAVLEARIDRLGERAKQVLQVAAVIGREFAEALLRNVLDFLRISVDVEDDLRNVLRNLVEGNFIHERPAQFGAEYAFRHPLTQEVALASQLQMRRGFAHAAIAHVIEQARPDLVDENAALLAQHHEQAGDIRTAARWHRRAAEWAGLKDIKAALDHWQKVRDLARALGDDPEATALTVVACTQALTHGWRLGASASHWAELFVEGCAAAERAGDVAALARLNASYSIERALNQGIAPDYVRYSAAAVELADRHGEPSLRCGTRACLALGYGYAGQVPEVERIADQILDIAAGDIDVGVDVIGFSAWVTAGFVRHRAIAFMRDPESALRELPRLRQIALDAGYPEQALWTLFAETEIKYFSRRRDGANVLAAEAVRLAERLGVGNELMAGQSVCAALACERDWPRLRDAAHQALASLRERGALRLVEPVYLAWLGVAELELGNLDAARAAASAGIEFMRASVTQLNPHSYAVLARAQLQLNEPAEDIAATLDDYAAIISTGHFHLFEAELHELKAELAGREGDADARATALQHAEACYVQFGMLALTQAGALSIDYPFAADA